MKNTILILISILIVVFGVLIMISAREDYAAEKLFYQALRTNRKILLNPDVAPPKMLKRVESNLKKILEEYPQTRTAAIAQLALADFYANNKKYEKAINIYSDIKTKVKDPKLLEALDEKIRALKAKK